MAGLGPRQRILNFMRGEAGERWRKGLPVSQRALIDTARTRAELRFSNDVGRTLARQSINELDALFAGASATLRFRPPREAIVDTPEGLSAPFLHRVFFRGRDRAGNPIEQTVGVLTDRERSVNLIIGQAEGILGETLRKQGTEIDTIDEVVYIGTLRRV